MLTQFTGMGNISVKVQPGGGCSRKCHGTQDNWRCLEPGPELWRKKGAKHKAWTGVWRPVTLTEGMSQLYEETAPLKKGRVENRPHLLMK
jgi:hypothetical protein